jgi:hypothetical protein
MAHQFKGTVEILNSDSDQPTIVLEGGDDESGGNLALGGNGQDGDLTLHDTAGKQRIFMSANLARAQFQSDTGTITVFIDGSDGEVTIRGTLTIRDPSARDVFVFNSANAALYIGANGNEGDLIVRDSAGRDVFHMDGNNAALYVGANGNEGDVIVRDGAGREVFHMDGNNAALYVGANGNEGDIIVRDGAGRHVFHMDSNNAALYLGANGNEGDLIVRDSNGTERIRLDGASGDVKLFGADCAEDFDIAEAVEPGTVMVIDDDSKLRQSCAAYDRRVAGVISGAGDLKPGIVLGRDVTTSGRMPVALMGKVFCKVDATYAPVAVGDLLTTSQTPGYAMRADDPLRAFGAVIGKALRPLSGGKGQIPVLIALQ